MRVLAYTKEYKNTFSPKTTWKTPSFRTNHYAKSEAGDTETHLTTPLCILKHQQNTLSEHPKASQPVQNFSTFSHHKRRAATSPQSLAGDINEKGTQAKFPHCAAQSLWQRQKARSKFEEMPLRFRMEFFGGLYMRSR